MSGYAGNKDDGMALLMAQVEADKASPEAGLEGSEPVVIVQPVETAVVVPVVPVVAPVDVPVPVQDSQPVVVAPQLPVETPSLRQATPQPVVPTEDWEQKFKTLQGMHNADTGQAKSDLATLQGQLNAEKEARVDAESKLADVPLDLAEIMGAEAYEDLGAETVEGLAKMVKAMNPNDQVSELNAKITKMETEAENRALLAQEQAQQASKELLQTQHDQRVLAEVPEFLNLVVDQSFINWLGDTSDPITGQPMRDTFDNEDSAHNSGYVANICRMYKAGLQSEVANSYNPADHVAPVVHSSAPLEPEKPTYKYSQESDMTKGHLEGKISPETYYSFINSYNTALADGRVT